jgi:hypothetical protein
MAGLSAGGIGGSYGSGPRSAAIIPRDKAVKLESRKLEQMQAAYRAAVEEWVAAVREHFRVASNRTSGDRWQEVHSLEERARKKAKSARREYEIAMRSGYYDFR